MIYTVGELLVGLMESIAFFIVLDSLFVRRDNISKYIYCGAVLIVAGIIDMSFYLLFGTMLNFAIMYVAVYLMTFLYHGELRTKLIIPLILLSLNAFTEMPILFLTTYIFDVNRKRKS